MRLKNRISTNYFLFAIIDTIKDDEDKVRLIYDTKRKMKKRLIEVY